MMKKILFGIVLISSLFLTGCGKEKADDVLKEYENKIKKNDSYYLEGQMEIINNEDIYLYDVRVSHKKADYYKVELVNTSNNHEQVILRNNDGVYV